MYDNINATAYVHLLETKKFIKVKKPAISGHFIRNGTHMSTMRKGMRPRERKIATYFGVPLFRPFFAIFPIKLQLTRLFKFSFTS